MNVTRPQLSFFLLVVATAFSGCVSTKYKAAPKATPPAVLINLAVAQPPVEAIVHSVIIYHGPGAWKRDAYWDEYVLSVVNRGDAPLILHEAALLDFQGASTTPGADPWQLESESKTWSQKVKSSPSGQLVMIGAGGLGLSAGLAFAAISAGPILGPATAAGTAFGVAAVAVAAAVPIYVVGVVVVNSNNKGKILAEYNRRRLAFPATLAPGQTAQGSLFFRISPGPQRLVLRGRAADQPVEVLLDLTPLRGLHLKPEPARAASERAGAAAETGTPEKGSYRESRK